MNKRKATRATLQTVALAFGLIGLYYVYLGLDSTVRGPWKPESATGFSVGYIVFLGMNSIFILGGGILVAIAWQNVRHFGPRSTRNLSGLLAFTSWVCMAILLRPVQDAAQERRMGFLHLVIFLGPQLLAFLLHRVLSEKLVALTGTASDQHDDWPANRGPCDPSQAEVTNGPLLPPEAHKAP